VSPAAFGNARVSYALPGEWPVVALATSVVGRRPANYAFSSGYTNPPYAPTQVELRATLSGPVPKITGLSYRLIADYAFAGENPYMIGPVTSPTPAQPNAELQPVQRFTSTVGLQYDLR
jgi:hypothetical protein